MANKGFVPVNKGVSPNEERNQQMVKLADSGIYTLEQLGAQFKITRERIRQIYKKMTGKPFTVRMETKRKLKNALKERRLNKKILVCIVCKKDITNREHRNMRKKVDAYCRECRELAQKNNRAYGRKLICAYCGCEYNPFRNAKSPSIKKIKTGKYGNFCKKEHYNLFRNRIKEEKLQMQLLEIQQKRQ